MMNRITLHHTGGAHAPNSVDLKAYHRLVDGSGAVHNGVHAIEDNAPGRRAGGTYAAHTRGLNTGNIGVSLCAMAGAQWSDPRGTTRFPPTHAQVDAAVVLTAELCARYNIPVTRETVLTHAEVQSTLGVPQRNKWDFDYDPLFLSPSRDPHEIGDKLRRGVLDALRGRTPAPPTPAPRPTLRRGSRGDAVATLQAALGAHADGIFGIQTDTLVRRFQTRHQMRPDGIVGQQTWAALNIQEMESRHASR